MLPTIDRLKFDQQLNAFVDFLSTKSSVPFVSFASHPYLEQEENYKYDLHRLARRELKLDCWREDEIGSGVILEFLIRAIELKENNIVRWQAQYGEASRPHQKLYLARDDVELRNRVESVIYGLFHSHNDENAFQGLANIFGRKYPLLAYLLFLKDRDKYLPIAPTVFDEVFELLGAEFKTSYQCSWGNYNTFLNIIAELRVLLSRSLGRSVDVSLLDAHSFAWILVRQMRSDQDSSEGRMSCAKLGKPKIPEKPFLVTETSFYNWLVNIGKTEKTAHNYSRAIAGAMSKWGVKEGIIFHSLLEIDSMTKLALVSQEIRNLPIYEQRNTVGKGMYSAALNAFKECFADIAGTEITEDIEQLSSRRDLTETDRIALVKTRLGQGLFRRDLVDYWQGCAISGYKKTNLLIASHIMPWKDADDAQRLDCFNGLLLLPNFDKAFDQNLISFTKNGDLLISNELERPKLLGIEAGMTIKLAAMHQPYMEYHRDEFFRRQT
jgi:hypothetical protein